MNKLFDNIWSPKELLNHLKVDNLFMTDFHSVMDNLRWVCQENLMEGQIIHQKSKAQLEPKNLSQIMHNSIFDKILHWNYFLNFLSHKVWAKKFLRVNKFVLIWFTIKNNKSFFWYIILSKADLSDQAIH